MKRLAIIGASYLQEPLIQKAKSRGIETHVFAWSVGDVGEKSADYFYPISIVEKDKILEKCRKIGIDGICSIASDLAVITVNYVAEKMKLVCNSMECALAATNKYYMRRCFDRNNDPSTKSIRVTSIDDLESVALTYPIIIKPLDRSGSRGITRLESSNGLEEAIEKAKAHGFEKYALVEEYVTGKEYSVEYISYNGKHQFLALTKKYTTGAPNYIETAHIEPAPVDEGVVERVKAVVSHALDSLGIKYGASHSEIKISEDGSITIIEIGARMGGDCIGSSLVELSTGYDFVDAVIDVSLGEKPKSIHNKNSFAAIRYIFSKEDIFVLNQLKKEHPEILVDEFINPITDEKIMDSSSRFGFFLFASDDLSIIQKYLPAKTED